MKYNCSRAEHCNHSDCGHFGPHDAKDECDGMPTFCESVNRRVWCVRLTCYIIDEDYQDAAKRMCREAIEEDGE